MKKYLFFIFTFMIMFFSFSFSVEAKSDIKSDIRINFGEEKLNLSYSSINSFKIEKDNSFYFNGINYKFNEDYTLVDDSIEVRDSKFTLAGDTFTIDIKNKVVKSSKSYETYSLPVELEFLKENYTIYKFKQELCYKWDDISRCSMDEGDISDTRNSGNFNYYYSFLPFYREDLKFEYLTYKFSLTHNNTSINFSDITFNKDEIIYKDSFTITGYQNVSKYDGKHYITVDNNNGVLSASIALIGNGSGSKNNYKLNVYTYVGSNYNEGETLVYSNDSLSVNTIKTVSINLNNLGYNSSDDSIEYNSFKLIADYVCLDCSDIRGVSVKTYTNEEIYNVVYKPISFSGKINYDKIIEEDYYFYTNEYYGVSNSITNTITFDSDIGIVSVYYLLTDTKINDIFLINNKVEDGSITIGENLNGKYYLYLRIFEASGLNYTNSKSIDSYVYLFDCVGPNIRENSHNFDSYSENEVYGDVEIKVNSYEDNIFTNASEVLFKVVSENEYPLTKEEMIENGLKYSSGVKIREYINSDGRYRVCFIGRDYLENYGNVECSKAYYVDISGLNKSEVSVSEANLSYLKVLPINISIDGLNDGISFKCALIKEGIEATLTDVTYNCLNNNDNNIPYVGEGRFNLWIYASDYASNYALIKLDEVYLLDNMAPEIYHNIIGDNLTYNNNVVINVSTSDVSGVNQESLKYQFYLSRYNENNFSSLPLDGIIKYPFNYYGDYKLVIKACDNLNNCKINTINENFLIDTAKIEIELIGKESITMLRWGKYKEEGARVVKGDNTFNQVTLDYKIDGSVDTNNTGVYYITYSCGEGINKVSVTREIKVLDTKPYLIAFVSILAVAEAIILLRLFVKKRKNDSI